MQSLYHPASAVVSKPSAQGQDSWFVMDRVFCGQYWDEFSLPSLLRGPGQRVLMLGLGKGAGVRPLLATGRVASLLGVDLDPRAVAECRAIYRDYFPGAPLETREGEARTFLEQSSAGFDLIWVDCYTPDGLAPVLEDPGFYPGLARALAPGGVVAFNAYGLPAYLDPCAVGTLPDFLASRLRPHFGFLGALRYRRNVTVLASGEALAVEPSPIAPALRASDRLALAMQLHRARHIEPLAPSAEPSSACARFEGLERETQQRWRAFALDLKHVLGAFGFHGAYEHLAQDTPGFFSDPREARAVFEALWHEAEPLAAMFPIYLASLSQTTDRDYSWFLRHMLDRSTEMLASRPVETLRDYLPQAVAMALHPSGRYDPFVTPLKILLEALAHD